MGSSGVRLDPTLVQAALEEAAPDVLAELIDEDVVMRNEDGVVDDTDLPERLQEDAVVTRNGDGVVDDTDLPAYVVAVNHQPINVRSDLYGAGSGGDDSAKIADAQADAVSRGVALYIPAGTYPHTGDLVIDTDDFTLLGDTDLSKLNFSGGGLLLRGPAEDVNLMHPIVKGLSIARAGSAGPAVMLSGHEDGGSGTVRFALQDVRVTGSTGAAFHAEGSYIGSLTNCYLFGSAEGLVFTSLDGIGINAVNIFGGEIQSCEKAGTLDTLAGINFFGTCIEGNDEGLELGTLCRSVGFFNTYWEANGLYDLKAGDALNPGRGLIIKGGQFFNSTAKDSSIILVRGEAISIEDAFFVGYDEPVFVDEPAPGDVKGYTRNCTSTVAAPIAVLNGSTTFRDETGPWTPYTPVLGGTDTELGDGTITGKYQTVGGTTHFVVELTLGSTTVIGDEATITLPIKLATMTSYSALSAAAHDIGSQDYILGAVPVPGRAGVLVVKADDGFADGIALVTGTVPFPWAPGDGLEVRGTYEPEH